MRFSILILLALCATAVNCAAVDHTIADYPSVTPDSADLFLVQRGTNYKSLKYSILATNLTLLTGTNGSVYNVRSFGAAGNGVTDDTLAIQAAINFVVTNGGGTVFFPAGTYILNGPFQDISHANSQLTIPAPVDPSGGAVTLRLLGPYMPAQSMSILSNNNTNDGSAIITTTVTQTNASQSILSTYYSGFSGFNPVTVDIENLNFILGNNPTMSGLNLRNAFAARLRGVLVWSGRAPAVTAQPTSTGAFGIATPTNNNAAFTTLHDVTASGLYTGIELNEHASGDNLSVYACARAYTVPFGYHALNFGRVMAVHCTKGIVFTGAQRLIIGEFDVEHANGSTGAWKVQVSDVDASVGSSSYAVLRWAAVLQGTGVDHTFTVVGSNVTAAEIQGFVWPGVEAQFDILDAVTAARLNSLQVTNEQVIIQVPWANGPTGALNMIISGQTYSIAAASAVSSFLNARTSGKNFVDLDVTNGTAGDLTLYVTAAGYHGDTASVITNHTSREFRFTSSPMGVRGLSQHWQ